MNRMVVLGKRYGSCGTEEPFATYWPLRVIRPW